MRLLKKYYGSIANADIQGITEKLEELNVKVYQYSKHLDGQIVFEIYQSVVRLFFSGIRFLICRITGNTLRIISCFRSIICTVFQPRLDTCQMPSPAC